MWQLHVVAAAQLSQAFAAQGRPGGSVTNVSSTLATHPVPGSAAYSAAKAGLGALTISLAQELAPLGIRANVLLVGVVDGGISARRMDGPDGPARRAVLTRMVPLGRLGHGTDVGEAVSWLVSAGWVTGATIVVDGGMTVRPAAA
jgi:NAD(P)-dependent dehydrogenase (short-subunit alcohol dehydrogenase family)